ncbi:MAG: PfkB family carbohydrate kinase, partial [Nanoarchaeota archaeon]
APITKSTIKKLESFIYNQINEIGGFDAIIVGDYNEFGEGIITNYLLNKLIEISSDKRIFSIGDSRKNFKSFHDFTCIKPNLNEARQLEKTKGMSLDNLALKITKDLKLKAVLITKDKEGMYLLTNSGIKKDFPAYAKEVVDVTGAGDSVTSAFTLALTSGFGYEQSAQLASYAAAISVSKPGVSVVSLEELKKFTL